MEFIPESLEALAELGVFADDAMSAEFQRTADRVKAVAAQVVGLSITTHDSGLTFTLVATGDEVAALDGIQYLDTGPCVEALEHEHGIATTSGGLLDEKQWHMFAVASAAAGVRSTLTFPVRLDGITVGTVNIYGRTDDAFVGRHQALAVAVGAWAAGAVVNADLSFSTRERAKDAPDRIRADTLVAQATGILAGWRVGGPSGSDRHAGGEP